MSGEQLATDLSRVDAIGAEFRAAGGSDDQVAAFYTLEGLAREFAGAADAARRDADEALGLAEATQYERDEARAAASPEPVADSEELLALRAEVEKLAGELATAKAQLDKERGFRREADTAHDAEKKQQEGVARSQQRRLLKAQGALAVAQLHVCRPEDVPHMAPVGVVSGLRIWAQNPVPPGQWIILQCEQDPSGERVTITAGRLTRQEFVREGILLAPVSMRKKGREI